MCFAYFHARYRSVPEPLLLQVNPGALKKDLLSAGHGRHLKKIAYRDNGFLMKLRMLQVKETTDQSKDSTDNGLGPRPKSSQFWT